MKKLLLTVVFLTIVVSANAQINLNVKAALNNLLRYGSGTETFLGNSYAKEYFENVTDARLSVNDVIFGIRYEIDQPIEYGVNYRGIKKRFIEYNNTDIGLNLRAGDYWEIVAKGLSFNTFEDRGLFYDTGVDGIKISYKKTFGEKKPVKTKGLLMMGRIVYNDNLKPERVETYDIRSGNFEISPIKPLTFGANYVYAQGTVPAGLDTTGLQSYIPEGYATLNIGNLQVFASYAHKQTNTSKSITYPIPFNAKGDGFYGSVSYSLPKVGFTLDYKNYRFDLTAPDYRSTDRPTRMLPFQNPPTAVKEHSSTLLSRYPHVVDFNDEVGAQFDVVYAPDDKTTFNLNMAAASRHYDYKNVGSGALIVYNRVDRGNGWLPSFDEQFSPWGEFFLEGERYFSDKFYGKVAYDYQNSTIYDNLNPATSEKLKIHTIPAEFRYTFIENYTAKVNFEQQFIYNSQMPGDKNFINQLLSLSVSRSPDISATVSYEWTTSDQEPTGKKNWLLGEVSYKINPTNTVTVSYGSERGGVRCTNGICRYVRPFEGFRLTVNSKF